MPIKDHESRYILSCDYPGCGARLSTRNNLTDMLALRLQGRLGRWQLRGWRAVTDDDGLRVYCPEHVPET